MERNGEGLWLTDLVILSLGVVSQSGRMIVLEPARVMNVVDDGADGQENSWERWRTGGFVCLAKVARWDSEMVTRLLVPALGNQEMMSEWKTDFQASTEHITWTRCWTCHLWLALGQQT